MFILKSKLNKFLVFFIILFFSSYVHAVSFRNTPAPIIGKSNPNWRVPVYFGEGAANYPNHYPLTQYKKITINVRDGLRYLPVYVHLYAISSIAQWTLNNSEKMLVNMIGSLKTVDNVKKMNNHEVFIISWASNGIPGGGAGQTSGATDGFTVFVQDNICLNYPTGEYRSWDTPIHEFGHSLDIRLGLAETSRRYCQNTVNSECFAWASESWFNTIKSGYITKSITNFLIPTYRRQLGNDLSLFAKNFSDPNFESFLKTYYHDVYSKYFDETNRWQPTCVGGPNK